VDFVGTLRAPNFPLYSVYVTRCETVVQSILTKTELLQSVRNEAATAWRQTRGQVSLSQSVT
jgi:hypothetical protein